MGFRVRGLGFRGLRGGGLSRGISEGRPRYPPTFRGRYGGFPKLGFRVQGLGFRFSVNGGFPKLGVPFWGSP